MRFLRSLGTFVTKKNVMIWWVRKKGRKKLISGETDSIILTFSFHNFESILGLDFLLFKMSFLLPWDFYDKEECNDLVSAEKKEEKET